jgi:hypothetical protein
MAENSWLRDDTENRVIRDCGENMEAIRLITRLVELSNQLVVAFTRSLRTSCELNRFIRLVVVFAWYKLSSVIFLDLGALVVPRL